MIHAISADMIDFWKLFILILHVYMFQYHMWKFFKSSNATCENWIHMLHSLGVRVSHMKTVFSSSDFMRKKK